jgi:hypothetical protein
MAPEVIKSSFGLNLALTFESQAVTKRKANGCDNWSNLVFHALIRYFDLDS